MVTSSVNLCDASSREPYGEPKTNTTKDSIRTLMMKIAKDRKVIPDPIDDRKFQEKIPWEGEDEIHRR